MKAIPFIFALLTTATLLQADAPLASLKGVWKSPCSESIQATITCTDDSCEHQIYYYEKEGCEGEAMDLGSLSISIGYKIEQSLGDNLYDMLLSGPNGSSCYGRIKLEADKFYLPRANANGNCSTPEHRLTEIDESNIYTKAL